MTRPWTSKLSGSTSLYRYQWRWRATDADEAKHVKSWSLAAEPLQQQKVSVKHLAIGDFGFLGSYTIGQCVENRELRRFGSNNPQRCQSFMYLKRDPWDLQCSQKKYSGYGGFAYRWHLKFPDLLSSAATVEYGIQCSSQEGLVLTVLGLNLSKSGLYSAERNVCQKYHQ